jgi:hypothetical protein
MNWYRRFRKLSAIAFAALMAISAAVSFSEAPPYTKLSIGI